MGLEVQLLTQLFIASLERLAFIVQCFNGGPLLLGQFFKCTMSVLGQLVESQEAICNVGNVIRLVLAVCLLTAQLHLSAVVDQQELSAPLLCQCHCWCLALYCSLCTVQCLLTAHSSGLGSAQCLHEATVQ